MTRIISGYFEDEAGGKHPAIQLASGRVVSRGTANEQDIVGLVKYAKKLESAPRGAGLFPQTADLAIVVRDELDKDPLLVGGKPELDGAHLRQGLSDLAVFRLNKKARLTMLVNDLPSMYPGNLARQLEVAQMAGRNTVMDLDAWFVLEMEESSGKRHAVISDHWPLIVPLRGYDRNPAARAIFPHEAARQAEYLSRKGFSEGRFYFVWYELPPVLKTGEKAVVMSLVLGGVDNGAVERSNAVKAYYYVLGRSRAGVGHAGGHPAKIV